MISVALAVALSVVPYFFVNLSEYIIEFMQ